MARVAARLTCSDEDRKELKRLSVSRREESRLVERARIVLGCLAGDRNNQIAARLRLQPGTVATWRKRFLEEGLAGLQDRARSGKPPTYVARELLNEFSNSLSNRLRPQQYRFLLSTERAVVRE